MARTIAKRTLQAQGFANPTPKQIGVETARLRQEGNIQRARELVEKTRTEALGGNVRQRNLQLGTLSPGNPLATTPAETPRGIEGQLGGVGRQLSSLPTPSVFEQQLQEIIKNRQEAFYEPVKKVGERAFSSLEHLPELSALTPGFAGLSLAQARQLQQYEQSGQSALFEGAQSLLSGSRQRIRESAELGARVAAERRGELERRESRLLDERGRQELKVEKLDARRQGVMNDFLQLRLKIAESGLTPDAEAGKKFAEAIQKATNPESILDQYISTAFSVDAVKRAFAPRKGAPKQQEQLFGGFSLKELTSLVDSGIITPEQAALLIQGDVKEENLDEEIPTPIADALGKFFSTAPTSTKLPIGPKENVSSRIKRFFSNDPNRIR